MDDGELFVTMAGAALMPPLSAGIYSSVNLAPISSSIIGKQTSLPCHFNRYFFCEIQSRVPIVC